VIFSLSLAKIHTVTFVALDFTGYFLLLFGQRFQAKVGQSPPDSNLIHTLA